MSKPLLYVIAGLVIALGLSGFGNYVLTQKNAVLTEDLEKAEQAKKDCQDNAKKTYKASYDYQMALGSVDTRYAELIRMYTQPNCLPRTNSTSRPDDTTTGRQTRGSKVNTHRVLRLGRDCEKTRQQLIALQDWIEAVSENSK